MKVKQILKDLLDIDQGILATFLTLFSDPRKVVTSSDQFARPWKYATYVATVSCLFSVFVFHYFEHPNEASFWLLPKRLLELNANYQSYYDNTHALKRIVLGTIALTIALYIFFFNKRNKPPGIFITVLYLFGHASSIAFFMECIFLTADLPFNLKAILSNLVQLIYLLYALQAVLEEKGFLRIFYKTTGVFLVTWFILVISSQYVTPYVFYGVLERNEKKFHLAPNEKVPYRETTMPSLKYEKVIPEHRNEITLDSLHLAMQVIQSDQQEISEIQLSCRSAAGRRWSTVVFDKKNRYSPDPKEVLLRVDSLSKSVFVGYRISNDSNSTLRLLAFDVRTGKSTFDISVQPNGDDVHLSDMAMDGSHVYLCGSAQNLFENFKLGMVIKINKQSGKIVSQTYLGSSSFGSFTAFTEMQLLAGKIIFTVDHRRKYLIVFNKEDWSKWTIATTDL